MIYQGTLMSDTCTSGYIRIVTFCRRIFFKFEKMQTLINTISYNTYNNTDLLKVYRRATKMSRICRVPEIWIPCDPNPIERYRAVTETERRLGIYS